MVSTLVVDTNTYVTLAEANTYLDNTTRGGPWLYLGDDAKNRALLTAARSLEKQSWQGERTAGDTQVLAFPRTGLTDNDGRAVDSATTPSSIEDAQCELAFELSQDEDLEGSVGTGNNKRRLKAGSAEVEYFRPESGTRFPQVVMDLIRPFLEGWGDLSPPTVSGNTDADGEYVTTKFDDDSRYDKSTGLA